VLKKGTVLVGGGGALGSPKHLIKPRSKKGLDKFPKALLRRSKRKYLRNYFKGGGEAVDLGESKKGGRS